MELCHFVPRFPYIDKLTLLLIFYLFVELLLRHAVGLVALIFPLL